MADGGDGLAGRREGREMSASAVPLTRRTSRVDLPAGQDEGGRRSRPPRASSSETSARTVVPQSSLSQPPMAEPSGLATWTVAPARASFFWGTMKLGLLEAVAGQDEDAGVGAGLAWSSPPVTRIG